MAAISTSKGRYSLIPADSQNRINYIKRMRSIAKFLGITG